MKEKLIDKEEIKEKIPFLKSKLGNILLSFGMKLSGMNKVNRIYDQSKHLEGIDFCNDLLSKAGINIEVENIEVLDQFRDKPFITVSNHAYGHIDGIAAIAKIAEVRSDYKMMVNFILGHIDTMAMHFIIVNPYEKGKLAARSSLDGIKECISHVKSGGALGFFPAGAVSKTKLKGLKMVVEDREWQPSVIKLIKKAKVPVIPVYFSGGNSWFFNFLDIVNWRLRSARLGHEVLNKRGKTIIIRFGEPVYPEQMAEHKNIKSLGQYLKDKTYELAKKDN